MSSKRLERFKKSGLIGCLNDPMKFGKQTSMITLKRKGKYIAIWIKDGEWDRVPSLDFIEDVKIFEIDRADSD